MKIFPSRLALLLAMAGSALLTTTAKAANDYDAGDLLLGFHANSGTGATQEIVVNLGSATQFLETNTSTITVSPPSLKSALDSTFGTSWATRTDVFWSVSGTTGLSVVGSDPVKTIYATRARVTPTTAATAWNRESETAQGVTSSKMSSLGTTYNNGTLAGGILIQSNSVVNSYTSFQPNPSAPSNISFGAYNPHIEGNPNQVMDLFRMQPGTSGTPGVFVGRFTLYSTGKLVFTPRDGAGGTFTTVKLDTNAYTVSITAGTAEVKVVRDGDPLVAFNVTANTTDGTALAGEHYTAVTAQTVSFAANEAEKFISVPITDISGSQPARDFTVAISAPTNSVTTASPTSAVVTIAESGPTQYVLSASSYQVNEAAGTLTVQVKRLGGSTTAGTVNVQTQVGTATAADFGAPSPATVSFVANGSNTIPVTIPITTDALAEVNETFTVKLQGPTGGATLGAPSTASVVIVDASSAADPTGIAAPSITSPTANQLVPVASAGTINVTGTATDNKGVSLVEYRVLTPGNVVLHDWSNATMTSPGAASTAYTATFLPATGTNTVVVRSTDFNSHTSTEVSRTFIVTRPLNIAVTTTGSISGTLTTGFVGTNYKEVGKSYTVAATPATTPAPGAIFVGWAITSSHLPQDIGVAATALAKQSLTFIFREGLTLEARFADNPFTGATGSYNGLVHASAVEPDRSGPDDGTLPSNATEGFFNATVQKTGAFSGKITIDGLTLNVAGTFDELGHARFGTARTLTTTVARTNKPSLEVTFDLPTFIAPCQISGKVTQRDFRKSSLPEAVSDVLADQAYYTGVGALVVPDRYLTVSGTNKTDGFFTTVLPALPPASQPAALQDTRDYPQGDGYGTIKISKTGTVTVTTTLADGTPATATTTLTKAIGPEEVATFPLFVQLYNKQGFLSGTVTLDKSQPESDMTALNDLLWSRPFQLTQQWYPYGWPEVINVGLDAAQYANAGGALKRTNGTNITGPDLANGNADLIFSEGLLSEQIVRRISYNPTTNAIVKVPDNDPTYTISVVPATGVISGVFTHEDDTKPAYKATIYQKGANAGAFGFFLSTKPAVMDYMGESGWVSILAP